MPDREKVIKWLDVCKTSHYAVGIKEDYPCRLCPYYEKEYCMKQLITDALALLKEQEEELSYREAKAITHTATKLDDATCPSCGNVVGEKIRTGAIGQSVVQVRWDYCRFCGQKLDWEGR